MNNSKNPFGTIIGLMREEGSKYNALNPTIGTLISIIPLEVKAYGLVLNHKQLFMNSHLNIDDICVGDAMLIVPTDKNRFIVACKVIGAYGGDANE